MTQRANPNLSQLRYGFEATEGLGDVTTWTDARFRGENVGAEFPEIRDDSIAPDGEESEGSPSKVNTSGATLDLNFHLEDHARFLAAYFGAGKTPVESPTGVWAHKLAVTETNLAFGSLALELSRDRGRPSVYPFVNVAEVGFNLAVRNFLTARLGLVFGRFHYWGDQVQTVGAGSPITLYLRGLHDFANLEDATAANTKITAVCTTAPNGVSFKLGAGALGTEVTIPNGLDADGNPQWTDVKVGVSDTLLGDVEIPVQISAGPGTMNWSLNDEFEFAARRPVWTQSLATASLLNEIAAELTVEGSKFTTRQLDLTLRRGVILDDAIGGRFIDGQAPQGQREAFGTISRRALKDLGMENRLLRAQSFELQLTANGPTIGATGVRRNLVLTAKNVRRTGRTITVQSGSQTDERIEFRCHPSVDVTYPAAITAEMLLSASSLA